MTALLACTDQDQTQLLVGCLSQQCPRIYGCSQGLAQFSSIFANAKVSDHSADAAAFAGLYGWAGWGGSISVVDTKRSSTCMCDPHARPCPSAQSDESLMRLD